MEIIKLGDRYYKKYDRKLELMCKLNNLATSEFEKALVTLLGSADFNVPTIEQMPEDYTPMFISNMPSLERKLVNYILNKFKDYE